ncbi:SDR family oxidoreductase [Planctomicrobium sp. SH661]|uniref:SDR family oxidoreductase n=1 Tax=Planctomicrobium sp. SH661 TaxID=3448124 RepID=UPI003F5B62D7
MGPERYTLLTGGTGLLGRILLVDLMRAGLPVAVVVRPGRERSAKDRIELQLSSLEKGLRRTFPRPVILEGELTSPGLGLSQAARDWFGRNCTRVLHSAAYLSFKPAASHPQNEPFTTNVDGTRRLAEFCLENKVREFHHISSAFACGQRTGTVLESEGWLGQRFSNDYEDSKCQAEELLKKMQGFSSLTIYRPSIVIDPTPGSLSLGDRTIYLAFSVYQLLSQRVGLPDPKVLLQQLGLSGAERKNIVPVNWVSRMIVQILRRRVLHGQTYHLTHPTGTSLLDLLTAFHDVLANAGYSSLKRQVSDSDFGELANLVEQFLGTFTPYFRDDPRFDQTQLLRAANICNESNCPDVNREMLQEVSRQQMRRAAVHDPDVSPRPTSVWDRLQALSPRRDEWNSVHPHDIESIMEIGLQLTGPDGGIWQLSLTRGGRLGCDMRHDSQVDFTIYTSTQTWNQLLQKKLSWKDAGTQGKILLETAAARLPADEEMERVLQIMIEQAGAQVSERKLSLHGR